MLWLRNTVSFQYFSGLTSHPQTIWWIVVPLEWVGQCEKQLSYKFSKSHHSQLSISRTGIWKTVLCSSKKKVPLQSLVLSAE